MSYSYTDRLNALKRSTKSLLTDAKTSFEATSKQLKQIDEKLTKVLEAAEKFDANVPTAALGKAGEIFYLRCAWQAPFELSIGLANDGFNAILDGVAGDIGSSEALGGDYSLAIDEIKIAAAPDVAGLLQARAVLSIGSAGQLFRINFAYSYALSVSGGGSPSAKLNGEVCGRITLSSSNAPDEVVSVVRVLLVKMIDKLNWSVALPQIQFGDVAPPHGIYLTVIDKSLHILGGCIGADAREPRLFETSNLGRNALALRFHLSLLSPALNAYVQPYGASITKLNGVEGGRELRVSAKRVECQSLAIGTTGVEGCGYGVASFSIAISSSASTVRMAHDGKLNVDIGIESVSAKIAGVSVPVPGQATDIFNGIARTIGVEMKRDISGHPFAESIYCTGIVIRDVGTWSDAFYIQAERSLAGMLAPTCL